MKKNNTISFVISFGICLLFYFDKIICLKNIISDIITFDVGLISFLLVFFTLIISQRKENVFQKIKEFFPNAETELYLNIKIFLKTSVYLFLCSITLKVLPEFGIKAIDKFIYLPMLFLFVKTILGMMELLETAYNTFTETYRKIEDEKKRKNDFNKNY